MSEKTKPALARKNRNTQQMEYGNRETVAPFNNATNGGTNHIQQQQQQQQPQQRISTSSSSISSTVDGSRHAVNEAAVAAALAPAGGDAVPALTERTTTTRPGAIHIRGWRAVRDDDSESIELRETITEEGSSSAAHLVETPSTGSPPDIVSAQLVDENEMRRHAELIFQQMLAQAAVVAEVVDEDEMRRQARERAARDFQQRLRDQEMVKQDTVTINNNNNKKWRQQRLQIIAGCFFFMATIIAIVVVVTAVVLGVDRGDDDDADSQPSSLLRSITPSVIPSVSFSPSITPSVSFSPSTAPSSMPSASSSWQQIGNSINGIEDDEQFGRDLGFSADGNTVVGVTNGNWNGTHRNGQVRAYSYHNETDEWKQLGQYITHESVIGELCLSPNGKFLGVFSDDWAGGGKSRIFALRDNKMNAMTENAAMSAMFWEQIGPDIVYSPIPDQLVMSSCLTDNLILAIVHYNESTESDLVYTYQFDANQSDWVRMGQEIQMSSVWSMQLVLNKSNGTLILAVGGDRSVRTFRYEPDTDSWIRFGTLELVGPNGVLIKLSMDGETLTFADLTAEASIPRLRTFWYDAAIDNWRKLGEDLQDSAFVFGQSFSLSANGKVLVATTRKVEMILENDMGQAPGQVRTWDFISHGQINGDGAAARGGEWIQHGAALEVGTLESHFGYKIALSADSNRLATSAIGALNDQGVRSGKLRVFEQY